jgi:hypothetical protein
VRHPEHQHQKALIEWAHRNRLPPHHGVNPGDTIACYLLAIPNGGKRGAFEAARLKAEGVKAGVSDLFLALPRQGMAGLWLEMKAPGGRLGASQREWLTRMRAAGYEATWADDWIKAATVISHYIGIQPPVAMPTPVKIAQEPSTRPRRTTKKAAQHDAENHH